jgi:Flp pilus assembly pilin Flp
MPPFVFLILITLCAPDGTFRVIERAIFRINYDLQDHLKKEAEKMLRDIMTRFIREDDGLEMLEWAIVALLFGVAGAAIWATLGGAITSSLTGISTSLSSAPNTF